MNSRRRLIAFTALLIAVIFAAGYRLAFHIPAADVDHTQLETLLGENYAEAIRGGQRS